VKSKNGCADELLGLSDVRMRRWQDCAAHGQRLAKERLRSLRSAAIELELSKAHKHRGGEGVHRREPTARSHEGSPIKRLRLCVASATVQQARVFRFVGGDIGMIVAERAALDFQSMPEE
jgi:hypothetical protein